MVSQKFRGFLCAFLSALILALSATGFVSVSAESSSNDEAGTASSDIYTDDILRAADIKVSEDDRILRTDGLGCVAITIMRAFPVEVNFRGESFTVKMTDGTVADAIEKAGITLTGAEEVTPSLDTSVEPNMTVEVMSNCALTVTVGKETKELTATTGTVGDLLADLGIELTEDDVISHELTDVLHDSMAIVIHRVEYKEETSTEVIDYGFVTEKTSSLASGTSKIKQYGIEGEKTVVSKNKYVDGELAESVVISEEITREPQDQIKLEGTAAVEDSRKEPQSSNSASVSNKAGTFKDSSGKTVSYTRKLTGTSTAYYAGEGSLTATGVPVFKGGVAVNPNVIPYGSKLYIVSADGSCVYGYATAVDTGGALMSGSVLVDVFYPTYNECVSWGRRDVVVYVL